MSPLWKRSSRAGEDLAQRFDQLGLFDLLEAEAAARAKDEIARRGIDGLFTVDLGRSVMAGDAEDLAEGGVGEFLEELRPHLAQRGVTFGETEVLFGDDADRYEGGSMGISIPVVAGIRLHTSTFTGKQRTDPHWAVADAGKLSATQERIIFRGESDTIEIPLDAIVGIDLLPDALQVHAYGVDFFRCWRAPVLVATIAWLLNSPEQVADDPPLVADDPPPLAVARPTKTCPDCAETILEAARVCRHCGFRFEPIG